MIFLERYMKIEFVKDILMKLEMNTFSSTTIKIDKQLLEKFIKYSSK